jgi:hypothetical protein
MKEKFLKKLDAHMKELKGLYGGACSSEEINLAEKEISLKFSDQYKEFLGLYGGGIVGSHFIYGIKKQRSMGDKLWSVSQNTNFYKDYQKWPDIDDWYVISDDGAGNPIGCKQDGSVWLSDHDAGFEQEKLADNFEEFLEKLLDNRLYE